ncbi:hypothetical protein [Streptomyces alboniger]|uniref:Uncharacterized protein n=1 Tax=Streptomyces alboniger TaxID=132473 RepID=A0A5J6HIA1_STRAD|nr:hypothetical protein [Streptomyces alboniger]QEV18173.1 hypothetical protein CP975_12255 [Streptomyces alboniger]
MTYDIERARQPADTESPDLAPSSHQTALLSKGDRDRLTLRLQKALNLFVESPRQAVQEADGAFEEAVTQLTTALTERRRTLRTDWQDLGTEAQTEELRLALRQYRETTERLLRM